MQAETPRKTSRRLWFFFLGCLFEGSLIAVVWLSHPNPTFVHLYNFALLAHIPFLWIADAFDLGVVVAILLLFLWAVLWAVVFHFLARLWTLLKVRYLVSKKRRTIFKIGLSAVVLFLLAASAISNWPAKATPFTSSPEIKTVVQNNAAFALDLYQRLKERSGNLFFSPYSISASLAMTSVGARGQTEMEMTNTLRFLLPPNKTHKAFGELTRRMNLIERWNRITLKTANGLWAQTGHPFATNFLGIGKNDYDAEIRQVDFRDSANVSGEINDWVSHQTKQKIRNAIGAGQLSPDVKMILCNAIYFKGKWKNQFKKRETKQGSFHLNRNETIEIPMMSLKAEFKMAHNDEMTLDLLELPYSGDDLSMVILLPAQFSYPPESAENDLPALERNLTVENLQAWLTNLDRAELDKVRVYLPRFTTSQSFELTNELKSLGMISAFSPDADFSGMDGMTDLYLSDVVHKTFVDVNETGTEAAAMTVAFARAKSMDNRFVVDHPFIFLIRENATGSILFIGRIVDPRN